MHNYQIFGLALASELALPGVATSGGQPPDAHVRFGRVAACDGAPDGYHLLGDGQALLTVPQVGRYRISAGREIVIDPAPGASERNVRVYLLGSAIGALLHQRGLFPLHANAVVLDGQAYALMGHSGAGKSTLAAWFLDHGHPILSDDVCVISWNEDGRAIAHRGLTRLRLWREALERSGRSGEESARSFDDQDKFDVIVPDGDRIPASAPLGGIALLARSPHDRFASARLTGVDAVDALMSNTYRGGYAELAGRGGRTLAQCLRLVGHVPVWSIERAWGHDRFDEQADRIEHMFRDTIALA